MSGREDLPPSSPCGLLSLLLLHTAGFFAKDEEPGCQILSLCPWQGRLLHLFFKEAFFALGEFFSFLLWEIASSFPQNIPHLLFKQGALGELWSLKRDGGVVKSFV